MEMEVLNLITNASINGYYDPSLGLVVVWFHKMDDAPDAVAYLTEDMVWDFRVVESEKSTLEHDREIIEILHDPVEMFKPGSKFDVVIRKMLNQLIEHSDEAEEPDPGLDMLKIVLNENDYNKVNN